ncbi:hypothetical protein [Oxynema aestuarii]|uniref:hypothetical protein n=1 Tax=Oxynema aestuarii TaxID=2874213 RepID=UPI001FE8356A|nr:hypothetical protein [Oxynema aestuarii]
MTVVRFPWDEFPSVWIHAPELEVKKHFAYRAAKSGNPDAAYQLVNEMLSEQVVEQLASTFEQNRRASYECQSHVAFTLCLTFSLQPTKI